MVVPFLTLYMTQHMDVSIARAALVMTLFGAGSICGALLGGKLIDKMGFYFVQLFSLLLGGIMFIILGQLKSYPMICLFAFLLAVVNDAFRPANAAAIAHYSKKENTTRSYALNRLAINLGWALGAGLGGLIASQSYELLFWIDGVTNIGAAILLWRLLAPSKNKDTIRKPPPQTEPVIPVYKDKAFLAFIVLTSFYACCFFQLFSTLSVYYKERLKLDESFIGIVMAMNGVLIALFEMVIIHKLEGRKHVLQFIAWGTLLLTFSFVMFNLFPGAAMLAIASMIIVTIGEVLSMPFMNTYWSHKANDGNRGQYAALYTISYSIGQIAGPYTGGLIADKYGFETLWWTVGAVGILTAAGYRMLYKREPVKIG